MDFKRIEGERSVQQNLSVINPDFPQKGHVDNCGNCVVAYELRQRGYDVEALPGEGMTSAELIKMFDGAKIQYAAQLSTTHVASEMIPKIEKDILTWGEGARGAICGCWEGLDDGHVFSVEVRNGAVKYNDGQNGKENVNYLESMAPQSVIYIRLDNLEPNDKTLNAVKNRRMRL